jgi:hypothetical protein
MIFFNSLEWWSYELLVLLSGLLPNPELQTSGLSIWYGIITNTTYPATSTKSSYRASILILNYIRH